MTACEPAPGNGPLDLVLLVLVIAAVLICVVFQ